MALGERQDRRYLDLLMASQCIHISCVCCLELMHIHTITWSPTWGTLSTTLTSASWSPAPRLIICQVQWTPGFISASPKSKAASWVSIFPCRASSFLPAVSMPSALSLKTLVTSVALCCATKPHTSEWPFISIGPRHTCAITALSNRPLDMQRRSGGWLILTDKCSITRI